MMMLFFKTRYSCFEPRLYPSHNLTELFSSFQNQLEEETELATQQQETLDGNFEKYYMLEKLVQDGKINNLARHYNVNLSNY